MLEGKAIVGETDMLQTMQKYALDLAAKALDFFDVIETTEIARFIKKACSCHVKSESYTEYMSKEFDSMYGGGWQCIVGTDFGSFVTHCHGCFIYFNIASLAFLLFKGSTGRIDPATTQLSSFEAVKA